MTIAILQSKAIQQGNGATTVWPYGFIVPNQASMVVTITDVNGNMTILNPGTQYTVTGLGNASGGNVTYPLAGPALAAGNSITIQRLVPYNQQTSLINQPGVFPDVYEAALDYLTMQTQDLAEAASRALTLPISVSPTISPAVPLPVAGTVLGWDPTAKFLVNLLSVPAAVIGAITPGQIVFGAAGQALAQDPNLFWDNTNKKLLINTGSGSDVSIKQSSNSVTGGLRSIRSGGATFLSLYVGGDDNVYLQNNGGGSAFLNITPTGNVNIPTSVTTPLVTSAALTDLQLAVNAGTTQWVIDHISGVLSPVNDNAIALGVPTKRISEVFTPIIDSGTTGPVSIKTNNGTTQAAVVHLANAVNIINLQGAVSPNQPQMSSSSGGGVGIQGTNTNDNATTGNVGEYVSSTITGGSAVALTTNVVANITSITLGAGDWDIDGMVDFTFAGTTSYTVLQGAISDTTGAFGTLTDARFGYQTVAAVPGAGSMFWKCPTVRVQPTGSKTYFLVAFALFTVAALSAFGTIRARRVR